MELDSVLESTKHLVKPVPVKGKMKGFYLPVEVAEVSFYAFGDGGEFDSGDRILRHVSGIEDVDGVSRIFMSKNKNVRERLNGEIWCKHPVRRDSLAYYKTIGPID